MKLEKYLTEENNLTRWNIYRDEFLRQRGVTRSMDLTDADKIRLGNDMTEYYKNLTPKDFKRAQKDEMKTAEREWIRIAKKTGYDNRNLIQKFIDFVRLGSIKDD